MDSESQVANGPASETPTPGSTVTVPGRTVRCHRVTGSESVSHRGARPQPRSDGSGRVGIS
eukprot:760585-Hanusia_phi.AAC.1